MSSSEKKYGKVVTVRLNVNNNWLAQVLKDEANKLNGGRKKKYIGVSQVVEAILLERYNQEKTVC